MTCEVKTIKVIKNDSTSAFGLNLFKVVEPHISEGQTISKIVIQIGNIKKTYTNMVYPFWVNLTPQETSQLKTGANPVNCLLFDGNDQPKTAEMKPKIQIVAEEKKVEQ